jgi:hypothetical protein
MIKHKLSTGVFFILFLIVLASCSSLRNIGIEVSYLPQYPISEDVQSLAIFNRSMSSLFTNHNADSLEKFFINKRMELDTLFMDSIASDTVIKVVAKAMFESGRYDVVIPKEKNLYRYNFYDLDTPLDNEMVNQFCDDFKVDGILVFEDFIENLKVAYTMTPGVGDYAVYNAATDLASLGDWRLYRKDPAKKVIRFQVADTINWKGYDYAIEPLYRNMPTIKDALVNGGIASGEKMANYICPKWVKQTRYYYLTGKNEIDAAVPLILENRWKEAEAIWMKFTGESSKIVKSKVEYNLALAAEMRNDFDLAIEWGIKSFKTRYSKPAEVYLKTLDLRKKQIEKEALKTTY